MSTNSKAQSKITSNALIQSSEGELSLGQVISLAASNGVTKWLISLIVAIFTLCGFIYSSQSNDVNHTNGITEIHKKLESMESKDDNLSEAIKDLAGQVKELSGSVKGLDKTVRQQSDQLFELARDKGGK